MNEAICRLERVQKGEPFSILYPSDINDAIAALRAQSENPPLTLDELHSNNCDLRRELFRVKAERDAAMAFIQRIDREYGHYISDAGFEQWRGAQEEA